MNIDFRPKKLSKIFNSEKELIREFGAVNARIIMMRMNYLQAAASLEDVSHLPPFRRHELMGTDKGKYSIDVKHPYRLIIKPNHDPLPEKDDGGLDLAKVTDITILGIKDTH
ncbi:type II toxin-antitoxin system RelE/ParE family toxin [Candidatus Neomarinimicrobiota bacterium]